MTIFHGGYSSLRYEPTSRLVRLWPLIRQEAMALFRTRKGVILFLACVAFVVVKGLILYRSFGDDAMARGIAELARRQSWIDPLGVEFYVNHSTEWGFLPFVVLSSLVGVRSISGDRATNALEIYWTRGISPRGYFVGKWLGMSLLLAGAYLAGSVLLWVFGLLSAPDASYLHATVGFMPFVVLAISVKCLLLGFLTTGFSAVGRTPNVTTFLWLLVLIGARAVALAFRELARFVIDSDPEAPTPVDWFDALSPWDAVVRIEENLAGVIDLAYPVWIAWLSVGVMITVVACWVGRLLRTTEAVG
jgi:ABC-type transport system involved in multi-copper enzyme maturation permease subunit